MNTIGRKLNPAHHKIFIVQNTTITTNTTYNSNDAL